MTIVCAPRASRVPALLAARGTITRRERERWCRTFRINSAALASPLKIIAEVDDDVEVLRLHDAALVNHVGVINEKTSMRQLLDLSDELLPLGRALQELLGCVQDLLENG